MNATQQTRPGARIVTVARDGARTAPAGPYAVPIYTTAVYEARPRVRDGALTWRRVGSGPRWHCTAGRQPTGPMWARAEGYAASLGVPCVAYVRHGQPVG